MVAAISALIVAGTASAQGMLLDAAADKVIMKYQTATCDELRAQKKQPATDQEKQAIAFLRNDSQARTSFIDKIAAPVLNKMFDCGIIR
jgi:hypothetical protein